MTSTFKLLDNTGIRLKQAIKVSNQYGGTNKLTENDIKEIYINVERQDVYNAEKKEEQGVASTYGEMLPSSVDEMISHVDINSNDVFYDLGSGGGKIILQTFANTNVGIAKGIEFQPNRYKIAEKALRRSYIRNPNLLNDDRIVTFYNGNILNFDLSDATIIYMCSTCYSPDLMDSILEKVRQNTNLKYIISLKSHDKFLEILPKKETLHLPMTWTQSTDVNIYSK